MTEGKADLLHKLGKGGRSRTNACKNLRSLLKRNNRYLPVPIECTGVKIKLKKPKIRRIDVWWPILKVKDFCATLFQKSPGVLLGGHRLCDVDAWKSMLKMFWKDFRTIDRSHPFFEAGLPEETSIPVHLHGDEGRGYRSKPYMVLSWQPAIPSIGLDGLNEKGFSG